MRQKQKKHSNIFRTAIEITIIILIILAAFNILNGVYVNPGNAIQYQVDSPLETYIFENPYNVSRIIRAPTYIVFNNTGFNITSTSPINIQINHIDEDISNPSGDNDNLLVFTVTNTPGATWFNLSGFESASSYIVKINDVIFSSELANDTGSISFYDTPTLNYVYSIFSYSVPNITINFAGNLSDSGGPYWRPLGESTQLTGVWSDGYYTNDSRQSEDWIYINVTVNDIDGVSHVWLQWLNETTWTNWTYEFTNRSGGYFDINTSNNFSTAEGYNYSFNIVANDTIGNSNTTWWNKTGLGGNSVRRYVQLNCATSNISYTPYYLYNATYGAEDRYYIAGSQYTYDRLHHDQGPGATLTDCGFLYDDLPTGIIVERKCTHYVGFWFNESICPESFSLINIYYHVWWSSDNENLSEVGWHKNRDDADGIFTDSYSTDTSFNRSYSTIYYDNGDDDYNHNYALETRLLETTPTTFTDNDIYELSVKLQAAPTVFDWHYPSVISNRSFTSFILFNVPDNTTLNTSHIDTDNDNLSDWTELYITYTNPFLSDTDNDGINDYYENYAGSDPNNYTETFNATPILSGESPTNGSTSVSLTPSLYVICIDADNDIMTATWRSNSSNTWVDFATNTSISTGTNITQNNNNFSAYNTTYYWSVNLTDGILWCNETYYFTTVANTYPVISSPNPSNGSTGISVDISSISATVADSETTFNWTIITSPNIGSDSANDESDGTKTCTVSGLNYDAIYYWTVTAYDGTIWTNTTYHFTVESDPSSGPPINSAPVISEEYPEDESVDVVLQPYCHVKVTDANLDNSDINFYNSTDGITYYWQQKNSSVPTGTTVYWDYTQASEYNTIYYWRVYADDGTINISRILRFTTYPDEPVITTYSPADGAIDVARNTSVSVTIFDYQGDTMNITWRSNSSGSWVDFGYNNSIGNGTYSQRFINSTGYNTKYWWSVNITGSWTNATYSFTTELNVIPVISDPIPRDGRSRISIYLDNVSVVITDANSNFNYTIETSPDIGNISENDVASGVKTCTVSGLNYSTTYTWYVNVTDGETWTNVSYTFTTKGATDFDIEDFKLNLPEWAMGPYKVYVGDFIWMFLFVGVIAITWGSSKHISSTFIVILLMFAAYGTQRVFVDNSEISLLFSVIAAVCIAAIMLGLFLRKRYG